MLSDLACSLEGTPAVKRRLLVIDLLYVEIKKYTPLAGERMKENKEDVSTGNIPNFL